MLELMTPYIIDLLDVVLRFVAFMLITIIGVYLRKHFSVEQLRKGEEIAKLAVQYAEQVGWADAGKDKYKLAKAQLVKQVSKRGIKLDEDDIDLLIEHAVKEMNKAKDLILDAEYVLDHYEPGIYIEEDDDEDYDIKTPENTN